MLKTAFENLRSRCPLIHNITNYVTVNDCANMVLACGASPIMADDAAEVEEITTICGGLNINIGTLNSRTVTSMLLAGKKANQLGHPVVLDPVGAGASHLRTDTAFRLLREVQFTDPGQHLRDQDSCLRRGHHQGRGCRRSRQGDRGESGQRRGLCQGFCRPHRRGNRHYRCY